MFRRFKNFEKLFEEFDSMFENLSLNLENKISPLDFKTETEEGMDEFGKWSKRIYKSDDGSTVVTSFIRTSNTWENDDLFNLKQQLKLCVDSEDFEKAIEIRDKIKKLENNEKELKDLKSKMDECIKNQNFEETIKLRDKISKINS